MLKPKQFSVGKRHFEVKAEQVGGEWVLRTYENGKPIGGTKIHIGEETVVDAMLRGIGPELIRDVMETIERDVTRHLTQEKTKKTVADEAGTKIIVRYNLGGGRQENAGPFSSLEEATLEACRLIDKHGRDRISADIRDEYDIVLIDWLGILEVYDKKYLPNKK